MVPRHMKNPGVQNGWKDAVITIKIRTLNSMVIIFIMIIPHLRISDISYISTGCIILSVKWLSDFFPLN